MKKFFVLMMVAAMSIACGGNNAEKKEGEVKLTVEQQAKDYLKQAEDLQKQLEKAWEADDEKKLMELEKKAEKLAEEQADWFYGLSKEDQAKALKAIGQEVAEAATDAE